MREILSEDSLEVKEIHAPAAPTRTCSQLLESGNFFRVQLSCSSVSSFSEMRLDRYLRFDKETS